MIVTIGNLAINIEEDVSKLQQQIEEFDKLEKAIEASVHYQLLRGKTQAIGQGKGRSRFTHTNNIANLVCTRLINGIYQKLSDNNQDFQTGDNKMLFELNRELALRKSICIAKAHDIGHVAFAHEGERAINRFFKDLPQKQIEAILKEHYEVFGEEYETEQGHINTDFTYVSKSISFEHNELSAIFLDKIMKENEINLSEEDRKEMIMGVLAHSTSRVRKYEFLRDSLPGQVVRVADKVEYRNADYDELDDLVKIEEKVPADVVEFLSKSLEERINLTVDGLINEVIERGRIWEKRGTDWDRETVMKKLDSIRGAYEEAMFLYDSSFSRNLLQDLFALLDNPEGLKKYYQEHPGIDFFYPEAEVRRIYETRFMPKEERDNLDVSLGDEGKSNEYIFGDIIPFKSALQGESSERINCIFTKVMQYYYTHPSEIPSESTVKIRSLDENFEQELSYKMNDGYSSNIQKALEYVSLFDDQAMMEKYLELVNLRIKNGPGNGIEPIKPEDLKGIIAQCYGVMVGKLISKLCGEYSIQEILEIYIKKGDNFYLKELTEKGMQSCKYNYAERFSEYTVDQELGRRVEKADEIREAKLLISEILQDVPYKELKEILCQVSVAIEELKKQPQYDVEDIIKLVKQSMEKNGNINNQETNSNTANNEGLDENTDNEIEF